VSEPTTHLPLSRAYLCADLECETVSNNPKYCPVCLSQVISLARILSEKAEVPVAQEGMARVAAARH
jgi:hypothetical protein